MPSGIYPGNKGHIPPNKGKIKYEDKICSNCKVSFSSRRWKKRKYCSQSCALIHIAKTKQKPNISQRKRKQMSRSTSNTLRGKMPVNISRPGKFLNVKRGWFDIDGVDMFFRSTWEANYALYLNWLKTRGEIQKWCYEEDTFIFHKINFGTRSYLPDFKIFNNDGTIEYHEVKGWITPKSKTQLKRMAKYYPQVKLILIDRKYYSELQKKVGKMVGFL